MPRGSRVGGVISVAVAGVSGRPGKVVGPVEISKGPERICEATTTATNSDSTNTPTSCETSSETHSSTPRNTSPDYANEPYNASPPSINSYAPTHHHPVTTAATPHLTLLTSPFPLSSHSHNQPLAAHAHNNNLLSFPFHFLSAANDNHDLASRTFPSLLLVTHVLDSLTFYSSSPSTYTYAHMNFLLGS
ncbi:hypothetical protein BYT27DRAFT_7263991 [Phlegmacium glaucopus]|nr:hypothetical protein BYT27DRAFT_7263991 [Phlegmacium glaucopus]